MAIKVSRGMLLGKYSWKVIEGDYLQAIRIDATIFNRHEGYEVIPMIQEMVNHFGFETEADVQRVEGVINNELPGNIRSKKNVLTWLIQYLS